MTRSELRTTAIETIGRLLNNSFLLTKTEKAVLEAQRTLYIFDSDMLGRLYDALPRYLKDEQP